MSESKSESSPPGFEHLVNEPLLGDEAFGLWKEMTKPVFNLGCLEPPQRYLAQSEWFFVNGMVFTRVKFGASTYQRTPRHIRAADQDFFHLHMPISGIERGQVQRRPLLAGPDRITLQDWSWPYYTVAEPTEKFGLLVPREQIERRDWIHERCPIIDWEHSSLEGTTFAFAWQSLWSSLVAGQTELATRQAVRFISLLNRLVDRQWRQLSSKEDNEMLLAEMMAFLDERLGQPQLGPLDLVSAFNCSRATIHRLFTREGGVRSYVRNQRLAQCFEELALNPLPGRYIGELAERWGFASAAHFSRAFRKRYGLAARQLHDSAIKRSPENHRAAGDGCKFDQVHRWLSQRAANS